MAEAEQPAAASRSLESAHSGALLRLERLLRGRRSFTAVVLEYSDSAYRDRVISFLDQTLEGGTQVVDAGEVKGNFAVLESRIEKAAREHLAVQVIGLDAWPAGDSRLWQAFNYHRELIAEICPAPLLLWVLRGRVRDLALGAPDFWSWRSGIFDFSSSPPPPAETLLLLEQRPDRGSAPAAVRDRRIAEINDYLSQHGQPSHSADFQLLMERGRLEADRGDLTAALESFRAAAAGYESNDDEYGVAEAKGEIARVLKTRGDIEAALALLRGEVLPTYERLRDVRERAITMGQIADILSSRGDLDEALRILREEALPAYEQVGDFHSRAITMGRIADILSSRGDLDEALRILREESLPVYEQLGDIRTRAITMGQIADILLSRGDLDEALRILREESLPAYEQLGDARSRAITMGQIAIIPWRRGDLDEALRIRLEEELPVYEQLGDVRSRAIGAAQIGLLLVQKGQSGKARQYLESALRDAERLQIPEAEAFRGLLEKL